MRFTISLWTKFNYSKAIYFFHDQKNKDRVWHAPNFVKFDRCKNYFLSLIFLFHRQHNRLLKFWKYSSLTSLTEVEFCANHLIRLQSSLFTFHSMLSVQAVAGIIVRRHFVSQIDSVCTSILGWLQHLIGDYEMIIFTSTKLIHKSCEIPKSGARGFVIVQFFF